MWASTRPGTTRGRCLRSISGERTVRGRGLVRWVRAVIVPVEGSTVMERSGRKDSV